MAADQSKLEGLLEAMRNKAGDPGLGYRAQPTELSGGFYADLWKMDLRGASLNGTYVARIMPMADTAEREIVVQEELSQAGYSVPAVHLSGPPDDAIDAAWMLMDLAPGAPLLEGLSARDVAAQPSRVLRLPDRMAEMSVALHRLDPTPIINRLGLGDDLADQVETWRSRARIAGRDDLVALTDWLDAHRPPTGTTSITHGDLHPFNILSDGHTETVIDWTNATIGDPTLDLAFTTMLLDLAPVDGPALARKAVRAVAGLASKRFLRAYQLAGGTAIDATWFGWSRTFHQMRSLVEAAGWAAAGELEERAEHPWVKLWPEMAAAASAHSDVSIPTEL